MLINIGQSFYEGFSKTCLTSFLQFLRNVEKLNQLKIHLSIVKYEKNVIAPLQPKNLFKFS